MYMCICIHTLVYVEEAAAADPDGVIEDVDQEEDFFEEE